MNKEKVLELLGQTIDISTEELSSLPGDTLLSEIGMSSFPFIQFIVALEETFQFEVLDSDLMLSNFQTIDMLFSTLEKYFKTDVIMKKVLICDCDNCLWHGISGEENVYLDQATFSFQEELVRLYEKGVLLCLCSKNDPQTIDKAFRGLSMPLKPAHILLSKITGTTKLKTFRKSLWSLICLLTALYLLTTVNMN